MKRLGNNMQVNATHEVNKKTLIFQKMPYIRPNKKVHSCGNKKTMQRVLNLLHLLLLLLVLQGLINHLINQFFLANSIHVCMHNTCMCAFVRIHMHLCTCTHTHTNPNLCYMFKLRFLPDTQLIVVKFK